MTTLDQLLLRTACNLIQWCLDRLAVPQDDAVIIAATNKLAAGRQALQAAIDNAGN